MADNLTSVQRSFCMSRVKRRGNAATELRLIRIFGEHHITGWRRHVTSFGNPDFVFPKARLAVFVDGCFWHGCPMHASYPISNRTFWKKKLRRNKNRDRLVNRILRTKEWRVLRIWQHELREPTKVERRITRALLKVL